MNLALFDLDNTLLEGDSDYEWGRFLVKQGIVDRTEYEQRNRQFFEQYETGTLDILEFARFAFKPLAQQPQKRLKELREAYFKQHIHPLMLPQAHSLLAKHRQQGDKLVIITSTNRFITEPIAKAFDVDALIATDLKIKDGRYTGQIEGIPCFQEGKVKRLRKWLVENHETLDNSWFYSDSHNDLPLLQAVKNPVAVDPDKQLEAYARKQSWSVISLREV